jgi:ribonucleotide monophosphatase NagD (HAD superfamily)
MVMIGDNEGSDILGAYQAGWESILVKTGVAKHDSQYATINAENILDGLHKCLGK